jgi:hypothetical protein
MPLVSRAFGDLLDHRLLLLFCLRFFFDFLPLSFFDHLPLPSRVLVMADFLVFSSTITTLGGFASSFLPFGSLFLFFSASLLSSLLFLLFSPLLFSPFSLIQTSSRGSFPIKTAAHRTSSAMGS